MNLNIQATAPQAEFLTLDKRYRLFCAGYGAGKSEAMVYAALIDAASAPGATIACYAPTNDLVRLITAPRLVEKLDGLGVNHKYNKQDNAIYVSSPNWGDFLMRSLITPTVSLVTSLTQPTSTRSTPCRRSRQKPLGTAS